jgi:PEP-CTERM motif
MKKLTILLGSVAAVLCFGTQAQAQIVSVQIGNTYSVQITGSPQNGGFSNYSAGVAAAGNGGDYYVQNWNDPVTRAPGGDRTGTVSPLQGGDQYGDPAFVDSTGASSDISFSLAYKWADNAGATPSNFPKPDGSNAYPFYLNTGNANAVLAGNGVSPSSGPLTLNLAGLNTTDDYTVIAYMSAIYFSSPSSVAVALDGQTQYYKPTNGTGLAGWVQGTGTSAATATAGNFVEFDNIMSSDGTLQLTATGVSGEPLLMGFQVIDTGLPVIPEPSTYVLIGLGLCALVVLRRRAVKV